ncbi:HAD family hydrolase [Actinokineospora inagensis]|uniref:HAD family hydrolase n=1 Tax=Actinokineospora inagensis TaxID=103730 RepID=UPI00042A55B3|nr:HAD family phosphatase [Actinokineospora inagensis]
MPTADAVLFDMDGVIVDSRAAIEAAWATALAHHTGRTLTDTDIHEHVHGRTGAHTVAALFPDHSAAQHREIWAHVDRLEETAPYRMIPGVRQFLAALNSAGVVVGLVTSGWTAKIDHVVGLLDLPDPFAVVISRDDVANGKPHPEPYLTGCAAIDVPPERTLVFEDSLSGVRSAVAAGTTCVAIGDPALTAAGAIASVEDFTGLSLERSVPGEFRLNGVAAPIAIRATAR